jgi:ribosome-binding factor A
MDGFKRSERVNELLKQELADLLTNRLMDPRVGFVTVTVVRSAPDLRSARVFVSIYGTDEQRRDTLEALSEAAGYLRRELGKRVRMRHLPALSFLADETLDRAERLDTLLHAAQEGAAEAPAETPAEVLPVHTTRSDRAERADEIQKAREAREHARKGGASRAGHKRRRVSRS